MTFFERNRFNFDRAFHKLDITCYHVLSSAKGNIGHSSTQHRHAHFFPFLDLVLYKCTGEKDPAMYQQSNKSWTYRHISLEDFLLRQRQSSQKRKERVNIVGTIDKDSPRKAQLVGRVLQYTKVRPQHDQRTIISTSPAAVLILVQPLLPWEAKVVIR